MKLFKSREPNTFHYTTSVCHRRVPVFRSDNACQLFVEALAETRKRLPLKLIGYVIMPDHTHLIVNPLGRDISKILNSLHSASASEILEWLRAGNYSTSLAKLALNPPKKRGHTHALWQPDSSCIDLWSPRFIRQKLNYIHMNPVRAGLCKHPADWKWSSFRAYLPHEPGAVPIEMDLPGYWSEGELAAARVEALAVDVKKRK
jgi:REP-associated tyrosine transposase